jgi:hypothetical protein
MTTVKEPRVGAQDARGGRPAPPATLAVWLLAALAVVVLVVTIVMIADEGGAACNSRSLVRGAQRHAQIPTCAPAVINPVHGRR